MGRLPALFFLQLFAFIGVHSRLIITSVRSSIYEDAVTISAVVP
jgi:cellobiose-specific phosphotransferase system component IIC